MSKFLMTMAFVMVPQVVHAQGSTPTAAVQGFFKATADSDLKNMALFFGNAKGPAATNKSVQPGWEQKLQVMSIMLRGVSTKVVGETGSTDPNARTVTTQLSRGHCNVTIAVTALRGPTGWVVEKFDLNQAQTVNRVCDD